MTGRIRGTVLFFSVASRFRDVDDIRPGDLVVQAAAFVIEYEE
jgi:hypothetical protein